MRPSKRAPDELRHIEFLRQYTKHAEGSVLSIFGDTKVLCTASIEQYTPRWLKDSGQGWLTAEYGMLPRSTNERMRRESARGKQSGRTLEIQRLIGRSLRAALDLNKLEGFTITIDCDVIQADGGTRTAAISGACVALIDALNLLQRNGTLKSDPLKHLVAGVSVGVFQETPVLDLDYSEDSRAETDMNVVMTESLEFIEVQGTAEGTPYSEDDLSAMLALAKSGIQTIVSRQREAIDAPTEQR